MGATLLIMAAGMGSRYGGNKQVDGLGPNGEILMEYSIYDAIRAGFDKVVFVIKPGMKETLASICGDRIAKKVKVDYAFQDFSSVPSFYHIPEERTKPFGTVHAVLVARDYIDQPFAVINADDYYGPEAFRLLYSFLSDPAQADAHLAVGYRLANTLTDHGSVNRGECVVENGLLTSISERLGITKAPGGAQYQDAAGNAVFLPADTTVSMNCWGFRPELFPFLRARFEANLAAGLAANPLKYEDLLPDAVCAAIRSGNARVRVLPTHESWFGVTYQEDKPLVMEKLRALKAQGVYRQRLWS